MSKNERVNFGSKLGVILASAVAISFIFVNELGLI